jgi:uncharacterized protein YegL
MAEPRGYLLPVYVAVDESTSMRDYLGELSSGLANLHGALQAEPMTAAKVRFSVLGFSDTVVPRVHLVDLRRIQAMPRLESRGTTHYGAAFDHLIQAIPHDVAVLQQEGYRVHRPTVFFLSDGQPHDDWRGSHRALTDRDRMRGAPNIIACGIGEVEPRIILEVATRSEYAFVSMDGVDLGTAVATFCAALTRSIVVSGRSMTSGSAELYVAKPEGFRMAIDVI